MMSSFIGNDLLAFTMTTHPPTATSFFRAIPELPARLTMARIALTVTSKDERQEGKRNKFNEGKNLTRNRRSRKEGKERKDGVQNAGMQIK